MDKYEYESVYDCYGSLCASMEIYPYKKKVLLSIGSNPFFAIEYWKFAKKLLDPIRFFIRVWVFIRVYEGFARVYVGLWEYMGVYENLDKYK